MLKFSIIIPANNEEKYIEKTINSIKEQNFKDYEVIVVANGCTDKTEEIVKKLKEVKLINLKEANVSKARNVGAKEAKGEILVFLDADTHLNQNCLEHIGKYFTERYSVATTRVLPDLKNSKYKFAMWFKNLRNLADVYEGFSGILICGKDNFIKVGGYPENRVVKEHRALRIKLKKCGKYTCLHTYVTTSMRRFEKWGFLKTAWFWIGNKSNYEKIR